MLVAVKIGNSTFNIALFKDPYKSDFEIVSFNTKEVLKWTADKFLDCPFLTSEYKFDCIICSVVPEITNKFLDFFKNLSNKTIVIDYKTPSGLTLSLDKPETFGVDRLVNAVAAYELFKDNIAVVDAGTATTVTIVTDKREILGGAIMPGLNTMNYALSEKTSTLPLVDLNSKVKALGKDTHSAILSGIVLGTVYGILGIVEEIEREINLKLKLLLTGGYSQLLSKYIHKEHLLNKSLVFEGMRLIYLKNIKN